MEVVSNEEIILRGKNNLSISAIKKVLSASADSLVIELNDRTLSITGANIEVVNLDNDKHMINATGDFLTFKFLTKKEKIGFIKRIFK